MISGTLRMTPKLAEIIADKWRGLQKFAADLAADIAALPARYNRGVKANLTILEHWLRAALLKLAEEIELTKPKKRHRPNDTSEVTAERSQTVSKRRCGFRCIEPDEYERDLAAENRFDISKVSGGGERGALKDHRPKYRLRLEAIEAVLEAPEKYALRAKRKLEARRRRARIKRVKLPKHSPLEDLAQVSPHSDLGRYVWYYDSG